MELPDYMQIEPVGQCNLRCQMCPIQYRRDGPPHGPPAFMPFDTFTRLVEQMPAMRHLHLQGMGEPMLHPRFFDMVAHAAAKGIRVTTNTNLTLLDNGRAARCVDSGLAELHGSLDAATAESFETIRRRARFDRVLRNLRRLVRARSAADSATPRIEIVMVLMRQNLDELPALVRLVQRLGADALFVQHLCHDFGESTLPARYRGMRDFVAEQILLGREADLPRVETRFAEARALAAELGLGLRLPRARPRPHAPGVAGRERCDWPWRGAYVSYRGEAMPCCMVGTPDRCTLGNMAEEGVEPVWNGAGYENFRARLASDEAPEVCRSCAIYNGTF